MGVVMCISNKKGGVGKTTLTVHLAAYLAETGRRVAVVDADPQGNMTSWLLDGDVSQAGMFELLVVGTPAERLVRLVPGWGVELLPGNYRTGEAFLISSVMRKPFGQMREAIRPLAAGRDVVLIDMPPSLSVGFRETLYAADFVLVPAQLERLALEGVRFMAETCVALRGEHKSGPVLLGIVPNMARRHTTEHQAQMSDLVGAFGPLVWPPIPLSVRVTEASAQGTTVFNLPDAASSAAAFRVIGERVVANGLAV
jgi:chromosome partitioning protein